MAQERKSLLTSDEPLMRLLNDGQRAAVAKLLMDLTVPLKLIDHYITLCIDRNISNPGR